MSGSRAAQPMMNDPRGLQPSHPAWDHAVGLSLFTDGVRLQVHVLARVSESRGERIAYLHRHPVFHQGQHPMKISKVTPARVKKKTAFVNDLAPDKNGAGQHRKAKPDVLRLRHERMPVAQIFSAAIRDDRAGERDLNLGVRLKNSRTALNAPGRYCSSQFR